ncbi:beta-1,6-galactofuranosyltransferase [Lactococcus garvieae]|uniref:Putative glycosyltransferase n=1 Tax=Lactococcus garvieae (strain Lg2) TaxID=420890 RepID=F9VGV5_LACGL|nr:beta-1,6-galactofuranosyltransferase [Lactococcus garvieae]EOT31408.1 hypothetical protein OO3_01471 [Lactococcus garvieae ATCC 49156]EOT94311.1 hypothetical protein I578_01858 [Lactococcus garvieae ATCC 49156]QSR00364.1 beta-1,6-galactofuranosyltransferase [Lactococcus garvieae]BAK57641.1 putative glycosyltransferase [Lactococcus garvieae ATCC 49156]BAK59588.1 putative glycosyltransferase [Lactococcus garvieae Lg2]
MAKFYFSFDGNQTNNGGNKAREDAASIFHKNGYQAITTKFISGKVSILRYLMFIPFGIFSVLNLKPQSEVIMNFHQFPFRERLVFYMLRKLKKRKQLKLVALIHDLPELQYNRSFDNKCYKIDNLRSFDLIIAHNPSMKKWLMEQNFSQQNIVSLQIFDYLTNAEPQGGRYGKEIIIAGNLRQDKTKYLSSLDKINDVKFNLYGPNLDMDLSNINNIEYIGNFSPAEVIRKISGSYGLVWDSESLEGGQGYMGAYQRYNNPHKASLYLAAGFPVIVWKEAALASFVLENNIGVVVESLTEISACLENLSEAQYTEMKQNVNEIGKKLRNGFYLSEAIKQLEK